MKFSTKLLLCAVVPAALFIVGLAGSIGGLVHTKNQFSRYIQTEQRISAGFNEMYAQGLQMGQALRNIVLDPANPRAFDNFEAARKAYEKAYTDTAATATTVALVTTAVMGGAASAGAWDPMPTVAAAGGCKPGPAPFWT